MVARRRGWTYARSCSKALPLVGVSTDNLVFKRASLLIASAMEEEHGKRRSMK